MLETIKILQARVYHTRHTPVIYKFKHSVIFLLLNLNQINNLPKFKFFSIDRFNLFSLLWKNYGFNTDLDYRSYLIEILNKINIDHSSINNIILLTMPSVLGYVFNPVSFCFILDQNKNLLAVLAEVNNTFGERHGYLCYNKDNSIINQHSQISKNKIFHVSPFCEVKGNYNFRFNISESNIKIDIDYYNEEEPIITTSIIGKSKEFTDYNLIKYFFIYPLMTLKVIFLIHYHALMLWIKKVPYYKKLAKNNIDIS